MIQPGRIVSSEAEELILVDDDDNPLGHCSKGECHDGAGLRHRAFSLFLFDERGRLLLQRRAGSKRLWPGYWSNSCCSHPRRGESMATATERRLEDELRTRASLEFVYKFCYEADYGDEGSENELCHVYLGRLEKPVVANPHEISDLRFVTAALLDEELAAEPRRFTPWLRLEWEALNRDHAAALLRYRRPA